MVSHHWAKMQCWVTNRLLRSEHWSWPSKAVEHSFLCFVHLTTPQVRGHRQSRVRGDSTCKAALQCASSGDVLGLQIWGKSCRSICDKKRFDETMQLSMASAPFELPWMCCPNGIVNTWDHWHCFSVTTSQ